MEISNKILSDITVYMKYAKYLPKLKRRETWEELVTRNKGMHIKKYPLLKDEIEEVYKLVYDKKIFPSMRSLQFAGKPIEISPVRIYNCSGLAANDWRSFNEVMMLLLSGVGVGISVQRHHVEELPEIRKPNPNRSRRYLIGDSIEGWSDAIKILMKSYFQGGPTIRFDYSDIRPKGAKLITSGGKAPGPQPLKECIFHIQSILDQKETGDKLKPIEVHDIMCHIADAVLAGGIRRAALISLFSLEDDEMLSCKSGNWWEVNPQRGRANNSVVLLRHKITEDVFKSIWKRVQASNCGEPGIFLTNDKEWMCNPCGEVTFSEQSFCNLTTINVSDISSQEDLNERARAASFLGTLQAGYTDFHYLRGSWKRNTEKSALLGVSMTGIASGNVFNYNMAEASKCAVTENKRVSKLIGINSAERVTVIKPEGTVSLVASTSSGIHAWHSPYYIRRVRISKNEALYTYLSIYHPELLEDEYFRPHDTAVISIPQKAPDNAITRTETAINLLERIKFVYKNWIKPGHNKGENTNNVSATVTVKNDEWDDVIDWLWQNKDYYNGITVLPYDTGTYIQAPFEECSEERYNELMTVLKDVDLTKVVEMEDNTTLAGEVACAGSSCEIV